MDAASEPSSFTGNSVGNLGQVIGAKSRVTPTDHEVDSKAEAGQTKMRSPTGCILKMANGRSSEARCDTHRR
jgi:hypothetical protein